MPVRQRIVVYVAGPLGAESSWDANVASACAVADRLQRAGVVAFVPHLFAHWARLQETPAPYRVWMGMDQVMIERCDALLRIPGESPGADKEYQWAAEFRVPRYGSATALILDWEAGRLRPRRDTRLHIPWEDGPDSNRWPRETPEG